MEALWTAARGGDSLRRVPVSKVESLYQQKEGPFTAPRIPKALASNFALEADANPRKQQQFLGSVAAALARGLSTLNSVVAELPEETDSGVLHRIKEEVSAPLAHAFRLLASRSNDLAFQRRDKLVKATRDKTLSSALAEAPLGTKDFFNQDFTSEASRAASRNHDRLLADTLRAVSKMATKDQEKKQEPRRDQQKGQNNYQSSSFNNGNRGTKRPFRKGGSSYQPRQKSAKTDNQGQHQRSQGGHRGGRQHSSARK